MNTTDLTGTELSAAVAVEVMGWITQPSSRWWWAWNKEVIDFRPIRELDAFTPDCNIIDAREVIAEIQRRGLIYQLLAELKRGFTTGVAYDEYLLTVPPADICRAALRVVREASK